MWDMWLNEVLFLHTGSPSDSNNSTNSSGSMTSSDCSNTNDLYQPITPICELLAPRGQKNKVSPYRRYIENILKTRALDKSLNFLSKLHNHVLKKTQLTLEYPEDTSIFSKTSCSSEEEELRRFEHIHINAFNNNYFLFFLSFFTLTVFNCFLSYYFYLLYFKIFVYYGVLLIIVTHQHLSRYGCWSPEYEALDLPSYRTLFIFLATVPLEVLHEYLLMRLEQKPTNPSALSIRQLMRELKQGLLKAMQERGNIQYGLSPNILIFFSILR